MNNIDSTTARIIDQSFASIKADTVSPDYFAISTDETIANYLNGMKGRKFYTMREMNIISVAMVSGRVRGISAAFRNSYGFNWSQVFDQNARYFKAINEHKTV